MAGTFFLAPPLGEAGLGWARAAALLLLLLLRPPDLVGGVLVLPALVPPLLLLLLVLGLPRAGDLITRK